MAKRMILMLLAMILLVGGILGFKLFGRYMMNKALAAQKPPPAAVSTIAAREESWQPTLHAVGSFAAVQGIIVSAQLDGAVTRIAFESGAKVMEGDLLVQQDVSAEEAQLASAEAGAVLARLSLDRARDLRAQGTNAQADLDAATAAFQQAQANVARHQGDHRQENHLRAVLRTAGHPPGQSGPVPARRLRRRRAGDARSHLPQLCAAAAECGAGRRGPARAGDRGRLSRRSLCRHGERPESRRG